jgi:hypothetical protein
MEIHDSSQTIGGAKERAGCISEEIAEWATHVAILSPNYIKCAARQEPAGSVRKRWHVGSKLCTRWAEDNYLLVLMPQPGGWIVLRELYFSEEPDQRFLCNILGDMPVLCPRFVDAARLADACYPIPPAVLQWRTHNPQYARSRNNSYPSADRRPT